MSGLSGNYETMDGLGAANLEQSLVDFEAAFGVRLSIHDHAALLLDERGEPLLPAARYRHQNPFCDAGRQRSAWDQACMRHCAGGVPARAADTAGPFVHHCWKGCAEVVVSARHEGMHICTVFAGQWASDRHADTAAELPPALERLLLALAPRDSAAMAAVAGPLELLAQGLVAQCLPGLQLGHSGDRRMQIRRFLMLRASEDVRLGDLARALGLSPSRTGDLVREVLNMSFQEALRGERIRRARALLQYTQLSAKQVAERVGFHSEYYFSRAFRAVVGEAPGRWRRSQRG
ncbi:MAG: helix-turn-helix domain-containing protein [Planctomycetota bacterium]|jgi:AraC-like DNA-binding protein/ligand-binding sensor protein|nr:helix-turn-helix domain-containing protein [Planctomycetota bacterium]